MEKPKYPEKRPGKAKKLLLEGMMALGGIIGAEKAAEAKPPEGQKLEQGVETGYSILQFSELFPAMERYFRGRATLDEEAKNQNEKNLAQLKERYGDRAVELAEGLVMGKIIAESVGEEEKKKSAQEKIEFLRNIFRDQEVTQQFGFNMTPSPLEGERVHGRGYAFTTIEVGGRKVDALVVFGLGRPGKLPNGQLTIGSQAYATAVSGARRAISQSWQELKTLEKSRRFVRNSPTANDFYFDFSLSKPNADEEGTLFLFQIYGQFQK